MKPSQSSMVAIGRRAFLVGAASAGLGAAIIGRAGAQSPKEDVVETTLGSIRGAVAGGARVFRGVPYAASTAAENRFRPPQPRAPWSGI